MALRFRYQAAPLNSPVVSLGGRFVRPRAIIPISLVGPADTWAGDCRLDTGADDTVFPEGVASFVGIDLLKAPVGSAAGVGGVPITLRYAQVTLRTTDGLEQREWTAWVGFTPTPLRFPLLGFAGFLQYFTAIFHGDREEVELMVNSLYQGT
jgi:hypothetical protein